MARARRPERTLVTAELQRIVGAVPPDLAGAPYDVLGRVPVEAAMEHEAAGGEH
jgi:hypothetical protein